MALSHSPNIVTNGLVLYLDAANPRSYPRSGTTWYDISGNGKNGTLTNGPTYSSLNSGSIVFDGTNDYINGTMQLLGANTTIEAVVKLNNTSDVKNIFTQGQSGSDFSCGMIIFGTELKFRNSTKDWSLSSPQVLSANQWYHLVLSSNSSGTIGYVNGISNGSTIRTVTTTNSFPAYYIGVRPFVDNNVEFMNGNIARVSIYSKTFTEKEVKQNFSAIRGRYGI